VYCDLWFRFWMGETLSFTLLADGLAERSTFTITDHVSFSTTHASSTPIGTSSFHSPFCCSTWAVITQLAQLAFDTISYTPIYIRSPIANLSDY